MAPRDVWTAEKGEQETQILFLKKINAEPPPNSLQVRRGVHRCPFLKPCKWAGYTYTGAFTRVQTHAPTRVSPTPKEDLATRASHRMHACPQRAHPRRAQEKPLRVHPRHT